MASKAESAVFAKAADLLAPAEGEQEIMLKTLKKKVRIRRVNIGDVSAIQKASKESDIDQYIYLVFKGMVIPKLTLDECRKLPLKVIMECAVQIAKYSELDQDSLDKVRNLLTIKS